LTQLLESAIPIQTGNNFITEFFRSLLERNGALHRVHAEVCAITGEIAIFRQLPVRPVRKRERPKQLVRFPEFPTPRPDSSRQWSIVNI
jgi:hypothetical protein